MLGTNTGRYPRHSKKYADFAAIEADLHNRRVAAFQAFAADVDGGSFPGAAQEVHMDPAEYERFLAQA